MNFEKNHFYQIGILSSLKECSTRSSCPTIIQNTRWYIPYFAYMHVYLLSVWMYIYV